MIYIFCCSYFSSNSFLFFVLCYGDCFITTSNVASNVNSNVEKTKLKHEKFQDLVMNTNTYNNSEFKELRKGSYFKSEGVADALYVHVRKHANSDRLGLAAD